MRPRHGNLPIVYFGCITIEERLLAYEGTSPFLLDLKGRVEGGRDLPHHLAEKAKAVLVEKPRVGKFKRPQKVLARRKRRRKAARGSK